MSSIEEQIKQGKKSLAQFKEFLSPYVYAALDEAKALLMIANNQIDLQRVKDENSCYTFSYLFNDSGYECLHRKHFTFDDFLAIPVHERYTLQYLFKDGLKYLEKGVTDLKKFLAVPEKKRLAYIDYFKQMKT